MFYDETGHLHLETDASGVGLAASLLHIRKGVNCPWDEAPHNNILRPITFASKCAWRAEKDTAT